MYTGTDRNHPRTDYGPACFDLRHNDHINLLYQLPHFSIGNIWGA